MLRDPLGRLQFRVGNAGQRKAAPYTITTTVDHESARYYLENYLAGADEGSPLHQRIDQVHRQLQETVPTRDQLRQISREFSLDFAELVFARQLLRQPRNAELQQEFLANFAKVAHGSAVYPANDGLTRLPDILAPNSLSIPSTTTDHFFAGDPAIDHKTLALLVTILERLPAETGPREHSNDHAKP